MDKSKRLTKPVKIREACGGIFRSIRPAKVGDKVRYESIDLSVQKVNRSLKKDRGGAAINDVCVLYRGDSGVRKSYADVDLTAEWTPYAEEGSGKVVYRRIKPSSTTLSTLTLACDKKPRREGIGDKHDGIDLRLATSLSVDEKYIRRALVRVGQEIAAPSGCVESPKFSKIEIVPPSKGR